MVDWTILSPTYLRAVVGWAEAAVTVVAIGPGHSKDDQEGQRWRDTWARYAKVACRRGSRCSGGAVGRSKQPTRQGTGTHLFL